MIYSKFKKYISLAISIPLSVFIVTSANAMCGVTVNITNNAADSSASTLQVRRLGVRTPAGRWRNVQQGGRRLLAPGETYVEAFNATFGCNIRRRFRFKYKCRVISSTLGIPSSRLVSQGWIYSPSETGWTRNARTVNMGVTCPSG